MTEQISLSPSSSGWQQDGYNCFSHHIVNAIISEIRRTFLSQGFLLRGRKISPMFHRLQFSCMSSGITLWTQINHLRWKGFGRGNPMSTMVSRVIYFLSWQCNQSAFLLAQSLSLQLFINYLPFHPPVPLQASSEFIAGRHSKSRLEARDNRNCILLIVSLGWTHLPVGLWFLCSPSPLEWTFDCPVSLGETRNSEAGQKRGTTRLWLNLRAG